MKFLMGLFAPAAIVAPAELPAEAPRNAVHEQWDMLDAAVAEMNELRARGYSDRMALATAFQKLALESATPNARTAGRKLRKFASDLYAMALDRERVA